MWCLLVWCGLLRSAVACGVAGLRGWWCVGVEEGEGEGDCVWGWHGWMGGAFLDLHPLLLLRLSGSAHPPPCLGWWCLPPLTSCPSGVRSLPLPPLGGCTLLSSSIGRRLKQHHPQKRKVESSTTQKEGRQQHTQKGEEEGKKKEGEGQALLWSTETAAHRSTRDSRWTKARKRKIM